MNQVEAPAGGKRDNTRDRVLAAARELFGTEGFDATTVRRIAERVGLSDAALYYHFKSKREILNAVWEVPFGRGVGTIRPYGPLTGERLDTITTAALDFSLANDGFLRLMCREILSGDETAFALRQQNRAVLRRTLYDHFLTVVDEREAELRAEAALALITGTSMKWQMESGFDASDDGTEAAFRERTARWVRQLARLEETGSG